MRSHTGQSLHLKYDSLTVGKVVTQGRSLLPCHLDDLLVTFLLDLLVPGQEQDDPQDGGGGGLRSRLQKVTPRGPGE